MPSINRKYPPVSHLPDILKTTGPKVIKTEGGVPVYIFSTATEPIVKVDFIFCAGTKYQDQLFISGSTNSLLLEGTKNFSGSEIAESIDFLGSYIYPFFDRDEAGITIVCLKKHLRKTLQIVIDVLSNPTFPDNELDILIAKKEQGLILDKQKADSVARRKFLEGLLGETHPYGVHGEVEDLKALSSEALRKFHVLNYHPDNLTVILTCDNSPEHIKILEEELNNWKPDTLYKHYNKNFPKPQRQKLIDSYVEVPHSTQASIRLGKIIPGPRHKDFNKLTILNALLGGYFGSRLMQNIREEKGLTYGIGSALLTFKNLTILTIGSSVSGENYNEAIHECFVELKRLREELCSQEELERVRNYMIGDLQRQLDGPFTTADTFKSLLFHGLDLNNLEQFFDALINITPKEIEELSLKYLKEEDFLILTAGPEKV